MRGRHVPLVALLFSLGISFGVSLGGCKPRDEPRSNNPLPTSSAEVAALRDAGVAWTNGDIRALYLRQVAAIGPAAGAWKAAGVPAEERARRAFQMRHDARILTRAMMTDPREVQVLEARDRAKYGTPDGPSFDWLIAHEKASGKSGDAVFEAIVASAQRTDRSVNEALGL